MAKEFWIYTYFHHNGYADHDIQITPPPNGGSEYLNVIEKSAYDTVVKHLQALKHSSKKLLEIIDQTRKQRDRFEMVARVATDKTMTMAAEKLELANKYSNLADKYGELLEKCEALESLIRHGAGFHGDRTTIN